MIRREYKFFTDPVTEAGEFTGRASPFGEIDSYRDVVVPGAYRKTLEKNDGKFDLLWQHDTTVPVGLAYANETTLELATRNVLNLELQSGRDAYSTVKFKQAHGKPMGLSIGFMLPSDDSAEFGTKDGQRVRFLKEIELMEISLVTFPAAHSARVTGVKSRLDINSIRDFEDFLRDAGFSRKEAAAIASHGFKQRDADDAVVVPEPDAATLLALLETQTNNIKRRLTWN